MNQSQESPAQKKRINFYLVSNFAFVILMLAAIPFIRSGQAGYIPHAKIDKQFVVNAITSENPESMPDALKTTEIYRASGYESIVGMMDLMQIGAIALALLFAVNGFVLFRLRQGQPQPVGTPARS